MKPIGPSHDSRRRGHGSIEEEDMTSEDSPHASRSGDLPGGGGEGGTVPADFLEKLKRAADRDAESELEGLD